MSNILYNFSVQSCNDVWKLLPSDDLIIRLGRLFDATHIDRFGFINRFSKYNVGNFSDTLPTYKPNLHYPDLCIERAKSIADSNETISVCYSGGVDSTTIISSFIVSGVNPNRLNVIFNSSSVEENPRFIEYLNNNGFRMTFYRENDDLVSVLEDNKDDIILTGMCNDQLYHHAVTYSNFETCTKPWNIGLYELYKKNGIEDWVDLDANLFHQYSNLVGWDIETLYDLVVLLNFGTHYTFCREFFQLLTNSDTLRDKMCTFYDTQDFQDWAFSNRDINREHWYKSNTESNLYYKPHCKVVIKEVFDDDEYLKNKGKRGSIPFTNYKYSNFTPIYLGARDNCGYRRIVLDSSYRMHLRELLTHTATFLNRYLKSPIDSSIEENKLLDFHFGK